MKEHDVSLHLQLARHESLKVRGFFQKQTVYLLSVELSRGDIDEVVILHGDRGIRLLTVLHFSEIDREGLVLEVQCELANLKTTVYFVSRV